MAVLVDVQCSKCAGILYDVWSVLVDSTCTVQLCTGKLERLYTLTRGPSPGAHPSEKCIVYVSEKEGGHVQYPGRNDVPVPDRLKQRGYVRQEVTPMQLASFERKHNVMNERRHFDRNGKGL